MGVASVDGTTFRVSDFSVQPSQEMLFYDHVIGLNDANYSTNVTKGEEPGFINVQKKLARPGTISIGGGFSFPATDGEGGKALKTFLDRARDGDYFDLQFQYSRCETGMARTFTECRINQFSFSVTAGDIVNISVDILAKKMENRGTVSETEEVQKLITWDKVMVSGNDLGGDVVQSINFNVNNNAKNIYTNVSGSTGTPGAEFLPHDIRLGMQEVSGTVSIYNNRMVDFLDSNTTNQSLTISAGDDFNANLSVVYYPTQISAVVGPVIVSIPFIGVDYALGQI